MDDLILDRSLLVTVGDEPSAMSGVRFIGRFFTKKTGIRATLFYTAPRPYEDTAILPETRKERLAETCSLALNQASAKLVEFGFPPAAVERKCVERRFSKVMDIIQEAETGLYDAVVLGRRGLSRLEEVMEGSVSAELFKTPITCPFWICRNPDPTRKNVLLTVDGSVPSLRMVDHVGYMLGESSGHSVTLFHVRRPGKSAAESIFGEAMATLMSHGLSEDAVETELVDAADPAQAILAASEAGKFAVVALGSAGFVVWRDLLADSVGSVLLRRTEGAVLWVCR